LLYATTRKKERKEREGKVHKVTRRYILAICGADIPRPIPIKFGVLVALRNVINVSNFCNKIFRGFRSTGGQSPRFPIDFVGHRYNSAQPVIELALYVTVCECHVALKADLT